jgi:hypothetical protein
VASLPPGTERQAGVEQLRAAQDRVEALLVEIRSVPGFADFPRLPFPGPDELARLSAPFIYLVPGRRHGVALRVDPDGALTVRPLPAATEDEVTQRAKAWRDVAVRRDGTNGDGRAWPAEVVGIGAWLWETAMGECAALVEGMDEAILAPCGAFVDLPLHAAWRTDEGVARYLVEDITVRYAPSLRAALDAELASAAEDSTLLTVLDETLTHAPEEVRSVSGTFEPERSTEFVKALTTRAELLAALPAADVVHFACHGKADPEDALRGAVFACRDGPLTLADIFREDLGPTRLVTLSACESAVGDQRLLDEVVNLMSGLLQAGTAAAIGSLWPVNDATTAVLMAKLYRLWKIEGLSPARALGAAQAWMRQGGADALLPPDKDATHPMFWAPFVFVGA